jgi:hypothetical protein
MAPLNIHFQGVNAMLPVPASDAELALVRLEHLDASIRVLKSLLQPIEAEREAVYRELDELTRPRLLLAPPPVLTAATTVIPRGFVYRGHVHRKWSYIDMHVGVLKCLWEDFPEQRDAIAVAVGRRGSSRAYVARSREGLFQGKSAAWAYRFSRELLDGWYVDTNLSRERIRAIMPAAVRASGLRWGEDVQVLWRRTELRVDTTGRFLSVCS